MSAILFGSIGTIAETSELQRTAFNQAFARHGLDWHWPREDYIALLEKSGGQKRIEDYGQSVGQSVNAAAIHASKSEIFQRLLQEGQLEPRAGVAEVIQQAKQNGLQLALVTTTSEENVSSLFSALGKRIAPQDFQLVVDTSHVKNAKPAKDVYVFALRQLGETPDGCVAVEDNLGGLAAARAAGLPCVAFPGQNTAHHKFEGAALRTDRLGFAQLSGLVAG
ncbi:MAG: HAD-IA family hydrolase [Elainellaceae cyanobacterium]